MEIGEIDMDSNGTVTAIFSLLTLFHSIYLCVCASEVKTWKLGKELVQGPRKSTT